MQQRPRRLRTTAAIRAMIAETSLEPRQLILPMFVAEGLREPRPISSMPGVVQHTLDTLRKAAVGAADAGLAGVMLFGVPEHKDARGSGALDPDGILTAAIRAVREEVGDECLVMSDVCLDEFTDHGHCGVLTASGAVDNDATVEIYAQMAVLHAAAGSHVVGPSGMMDGQVGAIREALDASGATDVAILAYSVKYASAFYGPFREAVASSLTGNRRAYQQDPANIREALREVALDVEQGADIVMVKPALGYLDVVRAVREAVDLPVAAYNVSGEYAMVEAAAANGWINRDAAVTEALTAIRRAGADVILSYWALEGNKAAMTVRPATGTLRSEAAFERAKLVTPGGVNSPVRAFRSVGGTPRFIASGSGAYLYDVDGNELVDLVCSWGPMLLGHAHPDVIGAVADAAARGTSYGAPTLAEVDLAAEIIDRMPVEQVRLVNSGTEATMSVLRLARGVTGRDKIIKFAGCYHGHVDALLAAAGSGVATLSIPGTPGVTDATIADTIVVGYNDRDAVRDAFTSFGEEIAAVITEAAPGNMGVIPPGTEDGIGFNAFLAGIAHDHGALLISDEVMTGFRVSRSGQFGLDGVRPDLMTFGKVMGGGFPAAAFGGRADLMQNLAPVGTVYQAGTLSGNPLATAAGLVTLRLATQEVYEQIDRTAAQLRVEVKAALAAAGVPHVIQNAGNLFSVFFVAEGVTAVPDYATATQQSTAAYAAFFHSMLRSGVYLPPSAYEAWFLSAAHDDRAVNRIVDALPAAAAAASASG